LFHAGAKVNGIHACATVECLVKSLSESFMNGYLSALGLKDESLLQTAPATQVLED
jgi:hypothetical protein